MILMNTIDPPTLSKLLSEVQQRIERADVFGETTLTDARLDAAARNSAEPAWYRLSLEDGKLCVALLTPNRWLSHSIEADLLHYGDKPDELLREELIEHGLEALGTLPIEHFRDPHKLFVFRAALPITPEQARTSAGIQLAGTLMLAFEATFRPLGDMDKGPGGEE